MAAVPRPFASPRHEAFVRAYVRTLSPSAAAVEAGYPKKSAGKRAWYLLRRPEIRDAISRLQEQRLADEGLSAARVLEELRRVAFADIRSLYDDQGRLKPVSEWTPEDAAAVAQCEVIVGNADAGDRRRDRVVRVKAWDKTKALELLARHFALLTDKAEVSGQITISWLPSEPAPPVETVEAEDVRRLPKPTESN
jgi:phage terminase small subunit